MQPRILICKGHDRSAMLTFKRSYKNEGGSSKEISKKQKKLLWEAVKHYIIIYTYIYNVVYNINV